MELFNGRKTAMMQLYFNNGIPGEDLTIVEAFDTCCVNRYALDMKGMS